MLPQPRRLGATEGLSSSHDNLLTIPRPLRRRVPWHPLQAPWCRPWPSPAKYRLGSLLAACAGIPNDAAGVAIQRERNGVVAGQRERSRDRVARAEVDGTPSASARAERGRQPRPGRKQLPQRLELVHAPLGGGGQVGLD